jgi:hypothetical protein
MLQICLMVGNWDVFNNIFVVLCLPLSRASEALWTRGSRTMPQMCLMVGDMALQ